MGTKIENVTVRALVRSTEKARTVLGCNACDESEGIFVGDITKPDTLTRVMEGADVLVSTVGSRPKGLCIPFVIPCRYRKGAAPEDIMWKGVKNTITAFAEAGGKQKAGEKHVVLISGGLTTKPNNFVDKSAGKHASFYGLQGEVFALESGLDFTIVKACHLVDGKPEESELMVGHDDIIEGDDRPTFKKTIRRSDVARVLAAAVASPERARGLRFDLCSRKSDRPTHDVNVLFDAAEYPWDPRASTSAVVV